MWFIPCRWFSGQIDFLNLGMTSGFQLYWSTFDTLKKYIYMCEYFFTLQSMNYTVPRYDIFVLWCACYKKKRDINICILDKNWCCKIYTKILLHKMHTQGVMPKFDNLKYMYLGQKCG